MKKLERKATESRQWCVQQPAPLEGQWEVSGLQAGWLDMKLGSYRKGP